MNKENLLILFGGESNEHEVSLKSASNVIDSIDKDAYNLTTIGITKDGKWWLYEGKTDLCRLALLIHKEVLQKVLKVHFQIYSLPVKRKFRFHLRNMLYQGLSHKKLL